jgi:hypothetical protein
MTIRPLGKQIGDSSLGEVYKDFKGIFWFMPLSLLEVIEARVTNGRGYIEIPAKSILNIPYAENPTKNELIPNTFCFMRMDYSKFPNWEEDLKEGHPDYCCFYHGLFL